jgi:hypothetical protein
MPCHDRVGDLLEAAGRPRDAIPLEEVEALVKNAYALQVDKEGREKAGLCCVWEVVRHELKGAGRSSAKRAYTRTLTPHRWSTRGRWRRS